MEESGTSVMERTRYKYVHIDSQHRLAEENQTKYTVMLGGHPIKNVKRVGVKQFTVANSVFNIRKDNNKLFWAEFWKSTTTSAAQYKTFSIEIPTGRYTMNDLTAEINARIAGMSSHMVVAEASLTMVFNQNTNNFKTEITVTQSSGSKWFVPLKENRVYRAEEENGVPTSAISRIRVGNSGRLWEELGFTTNQMITPSNIEVFAAAFPGSADPDDATVYPLFKASRTGTTNISKHAATLENLNGLYLTSDTLTNGNTYETRINTTNGHNDAVPKNILEWVQFDQPTYSYIHYNANIIHWHYLNEKTINSFDIQLRTANGDLMNAEDVHRYNLVLVFETVEHDEVSAQFIRQYNQEGYDLAHRPDRIIRIK